MTQQPSRVHSMLRRRWVLCFTWFAHPFCLCLNSSVDYSAATARAKRDAEHCSAAHYVGVSAYGPSGRYLPTAQQLVNHFRMFQLVACCSEYRMVAMGLLTNCDRASDHSSTGGGAGAGECAHGHGLDETPSRRCHARNTAPAAGARRPRVLAATSQGSKIDTVPAPQRLLNRTNNAIGPLFSLDEAATLTMSAQMAKRLETAHISHVGNKIRIHIHTTEDASTSTSNLKPQTLPKTHQKR
eukprot:scaffold12559_cov125-Isochrysis_galbana.AAC.1